MVRLARPVLAIATLALAACGGGGGISSHSDTLAGSLPDTQTTYSLATPAPIASTLLAGSIRVVPVDYFTNQPVNGAVVTLDTRSSTVANGAAILTPEAGLHALTIAASGYTTYNGGLQMPGGAMARTIPLFPVSPLMSAWLARVNADRATDGRAPVALDDMLTIASYDHAVDMGRRNYFAHFDTHGFAPTTRSLLLGSLMMGAENIAAGYVTWSGAEDAFMDEKTLLPNRSPEDCAFDQGGSSHYCNIVWQQHDWVGLAAVAVKGSQFTTYYAQEYGDLNGRYDTSIVQPSVALGASATLQLATALDGGAYEAQAVAIAPVPQAISVATLNADPECSSACPSVDFWYPAPVVVAGTQSVALTFATSRLYFVAQYTATPSFTGAGSWALAWPGQTAFPDSYTDSTSDLTTQSEVRADESNGRIAPNPPLRGT